MISWSHGLCICFSLLNSSSYERLHCVDLIYKLLIIPLIILRKQIALITNIWLSGNVDSWKNTDTKTAFLSLLLRRGNQAEEEDQHSGKKTRWSATENIRWHGCLSHRDCWTADARLDAFVVCVHISGWPGRDTHCWSDLAADRSSCVLH